MLSGNFLDFFCPYETSNAKETWGLARGAMKKGGRGPLYPYMFG